MKNLSLEKISLWIGIVSLWTFLFLLSNGAFAQVNWTNIGNGLQTRVVSGFREYRFTAITGYQPYGVTDSLKKKSDKSNFINIKDLGGNGNGTFNNTSIINSALSTYKDVYFPQGTFLVDSLVNHFGARISGPGVIVKGITGGNQQLNVGNDLFNNLFGQEYLSAFQKKIMADSAGVKVLWSGDSTTWGDGVTDPQYFLNNIFQSMSDDNGFVGLQSLNKGHSGKNTEEWRTDYLPLDLAENPDLYIIRWGINDALRGIAAFETSLRSGLATIRASKSQAQLSIILMTPNTTSDTPNGRDEKWYHEVIKVYRQAARDYQCTLIDTYSLWQDSRNGAATLFMDNPFGDGRAIHPFNVMNTWIVSKVFDVVFPSALLSKVTAAKMANVNSTSRLPNVSDLPNTYNKGVSINRAYREASNLWPVDGQAISIRQTDGVQTQINTSRFFPGTPEMFFRTADYEFGTGWGSWARVWNSTNHMSDFQVDSAYVKKVSGSATKITLNGGGTITSAADAEANANTVMNLANPSQKIVIGYVGGDFGAIQGVNASGGVISFVLQPFGGRIGIGTGSAVPTATLQVVGLVEYADNAAAVAAGLTVGAFYRTGDLLKIVH